MPYRFKKDVTPILYLNQKFGAREKDKVETGILEDAAKTLKLTVEAVQNFDEWLSNFGVGLMKTAINHGKRI